jgi:predicted MFS family arabinose efflux permease
MNLLNYIDRNILASVLSQIQGEFEIGDTKGGFLGTVFFWSYTICSPFMGYFGDRFKRKYLLAAGVGVWSLATYGSGLAANYQQMLLARCILGVGEASYATIAPTLIGDLFRPDQRNKALTIFYIAIPLGAALGYGLGSSLSGSFGWRMTFFIVGLPGLAVAVAALLIPEPIRGATEEADEAQLARHDAAQVPWRTYLSFFRNRSFLFTAAGMAAFTFAFGGLQIWAPKFLVEEKGIAYAGDPAELRHMTEEEKDVHLKEPRKQVGLWLGIVIAVSGLVGASSGGWLADKLRAHRRGAYFLLCGWTMLASVPFILTAFLARHEVLIFGFLFIGLTLAWMNQGPSNTIIVNVTDPKIRAAAFALNIFLIHMLGDIPSPTIMGAVSDLTGRLFWGVILTAPAMALSGIFFCLGARHLEADQEAMVKGLRGG